MNASLKARVARCVLILVTAVLVGCGGGTTGTDGGGVNVRFSGTVSNTIGNPVENATVVIEESGDAAQTDNQGRFEIQTNLDSSEATLRIITADTEGVTHIQNIPSVESNVAIIVEFDLESGGIILENVEVEVQEIETPVPVETQGDTGPSATPTPETTQESLVEGNIALRYFGNLKGARVRVVGFGKETKSDSRGFFRLRFPVGQRTVTLQITSQFGSGTVKFGNLPARPIRLVADILLGPPADQIIPSDETVVGEIYSADSILTIANQSQVIKERK